MLLRSPISPTLTTRKLSFLKTNYFKSSGTFIARCSTNYSLAECFHLNNITIMYSSVLFTYRTIKEEEGGIIDFFCTWHIS